jgi:hypothetical protein
VTFSDVGSTPTASTIFSVILSLRSTPPQVHLDFDIRSRLLQCRSARGRPRRLDRVFTLKVFDRRLHLLLDIAPSPVIPSCCDLQAHLAVGVGPPQLGLAPVLDGCLDSL